MASTLESWVIVGGDEIYLNPEKFNKENHAEIVNKLFSEMVDGYPNVPTPRPTQTHIYDFGCTFMGAWLLDGECKATATNADKGFMVLHCLDQLVTQDMALHVLTTSNRFYFYRSLKIDTKCIETTHCESNSYVLGQVGKEDHHRNKDWLQKLPTLLEVIPVAEVGRITYQMVTWSEHDQSIMASWNSLRSELKNSCMQCQMQLTFWGNTLLPSIWQKSKIRELSHSQWNGRSLISCPQMCGSCKLKGR